jgi:putative membrane protein insertion efficiency factor
MTKNGNQKKGLIQDLLLKAIVFYQRFISPLMGRHCRFYPSCSQFFLESVEKYGTLKGIKKGLTRILRCSHLSLGGIDLP